MTARPLLLVISDRPHVWVGFRSPEREVRRWVGERDSDEERASPANFSGDPTDPETYRWALASHDLSAVIDLHDSERAKGAINALRYVRPEAGVLVISADDDVGTAGIEVSRRLAWTDALRGDLEAELQQLEMLRRLNDLRKFAEGEHDVPILVHADPDPDALASALALRALLRRDPMSTPIITLGGITRPENRRMAELLRMRVTRVTADEVRKLPRVIAVDFQPCFLAAGERPKLAIVDHHPADPRLVAEFSDIRPRYGATATMMTEYLRVDDERRIGKPLATALLYGIRTDTDTLAKGCIPADVTAYAFLQAKADLPFLRRLERPSYSIETAREYGIALGHIAIDEDLAAVFLGAVREEDAHVLADISDFCLALQEITWAVAGALINGEIVMAIRHLGGQASAGDLAKMLTHAGGTGGGHAVMARAVIERKGAWAELKTEDPAHASAELCGLVRTYLNDLCPNRRSSRPALPAKVPSSAT